MSSLPVSQALLMIRSRVPGKVFHMLRDPLTNELGQGTEEDDVVDMLLALSQLFRFPIQMPHLEPVKQLLMNAAITDNEADAKLQSDIENMTVDGILAHDAEKGCTRDPLVAALYAVSCMYPLKTPEARLESLTFALSEAAQDMIDLAE